MATSNRKQVTCPYPTFSSPFMAQEDGKTLLKEEREAFLAPFCPTSANRVLLTLKMANVSEKDTVLDLGSGDGRFCTAAVSVYNAARAVGIESDSELVSLSRTLCQRVLGSTRSSAVEFVEGDLLALPSR
ncbi:hypothetical protein BDF14DRAFT_1830440 [Spinellus fusiger]|nr:hypothetical protein BDF14DRAFT_1830440 [Spinellus fusiger]